MKNKNKYLLSTPLNTEQAQQAWFVVAAICNTPTLPMVAPYIAIKTLPTGFSWTDVSCNAFSVMCSGTE